MMKWNKIKEEKQLSEAERRRIKQTLYRILVQNEVAIARIQDGQITVSPIWDYVCRLAGVKS